MMDHSQLARRARLRVPTRRPRAARVYQIVFASQVITDIMECVPRVHRDHINRTLEMLPVIYVLPQTQTPTLLLRHLQV